MSDNPFESDFFTIRVQITATEEDVVVEEKVVEYKTEEAGNLDQAATTLSWESAFLLEQ